MKTSLKIAGWLLWSCCAASFTSLCAAPAQALPQSVQVPVAAQPSPPAVPALPDDVDPGEWSQSHHHQHHHADNDNARVNVGHDVFLAENEKADDVVAVLGSATSAGIVANSVVSIAGSTHVTGPVGDSAVAVLGSVFVDSAVAGDVVAVLGNIELGPNANVGGDLVAVGGTVKRDPASKVGGQSRDVAIGGGHWSGIGALEPWLKHCFYLGRPLAFVPGIGWAWTLALVVLALYALLALLFGSAVDQCVTTLERHPGASLITSVLAMIGTPILFVVLVITVVGILAVPFLGIAVLLAQFFGKLVMLAWIGRRVVKATPANAGWHAAAATLVGGAIVLLLYTVPVLGALLYHLLGLIGFGVVLYTLLLQMRGRRPVHAQAGATAATAAAPALASSAPPVGEPAATLSESVAATSAPNSAEQPSAQQPSSAQTPSPGEAAAAAAPPGARAKRVPAAAAIAMPRAGFWIRMVALLFDVILVAVVLHLLQDSSHLFLVFLAAYGAVMWKLRGSTVGDIIFNLQVVQQDGREMEWSTAVVRALSSFLSLIAIGLGFIWIAVDEERRAWHDKIAGTIVVRVP